MKLLKHLEGTRTDAIIILILLVYGFFRLTTFDTWVSLSIFFFVIGAVLGLTARHQLGNSFSVTAKATALITQGVYSKIRHPIYTAGAIICIGFCMLYQHWIIYIISFFFLILQIFRATKEEKILVNAFGQKYTTYKKSTWF